MLQQICALSSKLNDRGRDGNLSRLGEQGDAFHPLGDMIHHYQDNSLLHGARVPENLEISKGPADPE